jgi:hypothetical protein
MEPNRIAFLLGAGASFGAGHTLPTSPPLGNALFDELAAKYPANWGSASRLGLHAVALRVDFEATFSEVSGRIPAIDVLEWDRDIARFFGLFSLDETGQDLYTRLLDCLKTTGTLAATTFASLNYDCLLELAVDALRLNINYSARDEDPSAVQVLKLHGSCNFISPELSQSRAHLTMPGSFLGCHLDVLSPRNLPKVLDSKYRKGNDHYYYPILSRYAFGKNTHLAGQEIQKIRNAWSQEAAEATHLAIVGVRFNDRDPHITAPIAQTPAQTVLYVGSNEDFEQWRALNPKCQHMGERFDESFDRLCDGLLRAGASC